MAVSSPWPVLERTSRVSGMLGSHSYQRSLSQCWRIPNLKSIIFKKVRCCVSSGFSTEFMKKGSEIKNKAGIYTLNFLRNINLKVWPGLEALNLKAGHGGGCCKIQHHLLIQLGLKMATKIFCVNEYEGGRICSRCSVIQSPQKTFHLIRFWLK